MPKNQAPCHGINFLRFMKLQYKAYQRNGYKIDPILETFHECGIIISDIRIFDTIKNYLASYDFWKKIPPDSQYVAYKNVAHDTIKRFAKVMPRLARAARKQGKYVDINQVWNRVAYNRIVVISGPPSLPDLRPIKFKSLYHAEKNTTYYFYAEDDVSALTSDPRGHRHIPYLPKQEEIKITGPHGRV